MAARIPMMATTIINSMSVKPRWLPSTFRFQNFVIRTSNLDEVIQFSVHSGPALGHEKGADSVPRGTTSGRGKQELGLAEK
jgi:hypothetical protein